MKAAIRVWIPVVLVIALACAGFYFGPQMVGRFAYAVEAGRSEAIRSELAELSKHDQLSVLFRAVAKAVGPAVVEVRVTKKLQQGVPDLERFFKGFGDDWPFGPEFRTPELKKREFYARGLGSGFIVDAKNGYVMTNYHVVGGADNVVVVLADKRQLKAEWVRTDAMSDLAVIKVKADNLVAVPLGDSNAMEPGDWVLAIGAPRDLPQTVTAGIISAKGRVDRERPGMYQNFIQTDASINRGNSGGPLVNTRGEVIGISNSIMSYSGGFEGIGFAIPSNMARQVMTQLIDKGKVTRGYLGVGIQNVDENLARSFKLPDTKGALVSQVAEDSPAGKAGIKTGDFIVAIDGSATPDVNWLRNVVAGIEPGKAVSVDLYRDGKKTTVKVTLTAQPKDMAAALGGEEQPQAPEKTAARKFGLEVTTLTRELARKYGYSTSLKGVMITEVDGASSAAEQGLAPGTVLTHVQNKPVTTAEEFAQALEAKEAASGVRLRIMDRSGAQRFAFITPTK